MRCPYCGYDKVQPNFNFCPLCKKPLNENANTMKTPHASQSNQDLHEKNAFTRLFDGWTYEKAIADPYSYAKWAYKNPFNHKDLLRKWIIKGNDTTIIRSAIAERQKQIEIILNESVKEIVAAEALAEAEALVTKRYLDEEHLGGLIHPPKEAEESIKMDEEDLANLAKRKMEELREQILEFGLRTFEKK